MATPLENRGLPFSSCVPSTVPCLVSSFREAKMPAQPPSSKHSSTVIDEMKQTEEMLANELSKLSMQERSEAYDDVHCVGDELHETPEMIQKSFMEFDQAIQRHKNAAYDMALKQNTDYIEDPSFRLMFLRAQMHNVDKAVHQMMKFLQYKGEYFGEDKLGRDITLADLSEEEMGIMLSGLFHIQDGRDRMGRVIVYWFHHMVGKFNPDSTFRAWYYVLYSILIPLPEVQMKGVAEVYLGTQKQKEEGMVQNDAAFRKMLDAGTAMPFRISASHKCLNIPDNGSLSLENAMIALYVRGMSLYSRVRTRIHYGTFMELKYKLGTHGIPTDTCPVDTDGETREEIINAWFFKHQAEEDNIKLNNEDASSATECPKVSHQIPRTNGASITPTENDVLSGRGRYFQDYPGNARFRKFMEDHSEEYDRLDRHDRMILTIRLMHDLSSNNVRFLKQIESGDWVTLDGAEVRKKVSQQFRSIRKKNRSV